MKYFVIDAFSTELFKGNPAGVCIVEEPLTEDIMQKIAFENNLAETAFLSMQDGYYDLRWFTPEVEIDLCGHATLASAYVVLNHLEISKNNVEFHTMSGVLTVERNHDLYTMRFPRRKPVPCQIPDLLEEALGAKILEAHMSRDLLVLLENEEILNNLTPDFQKLKQIDGSFAIIVTAKSRTYDFVSRFFAPNAGISEDPVTGSAHSTLIPFWSERLKKTEMVAAQLSQRGGIITCKDNIDSVNISGNAVCYMIGEIIINKVK